MSLPYPPRIHHPLANYRRYIKYLRAILIYSLAFTSLCLFFGGSLCWCCILACRIFSLRCFSTLLCTERVTLTYLLAIYRIEKLQSLHFNVVLWTLLGGNGKYFREIQLTVHTLNAKHRKKIEKTKKTPRKKQIGLCFIGVHKLDTLLNSRKFVS